MDENFRRAAGVFGTTSDAFVCSDQTHTTNIRRVEKEDAGKGVTKEKDYRDVDGLITNVPGLILGTFYADCVPLLFVDPVHHAIGCSHSGWYSFFSGLRIFPELGQGDSFLAVHGYI